MTSFASLGIPDDLLDALAAKGMENAFDVQAATIPDALAGRDVCGRAPTGSGKTLAFGIPMVARAKRSKPKRPRGLVLVPTRELAAQVARDLSWLGAARDTRVQTFYGGVKFESQLKALRRGVDIAVACPGRLADLVSQGQFRLDEVEFVVIDEADRMADMGFLPEVRRILDQTSADRQTLLFSATLDGDVDVLVRNYQRDPVSHDTSPPEQDRSNITHLFWKVDRAKRTEICADIVSQAGPTIVFVRTRHGADRLATRLDRLGISSESIHGDRSQRQRERALAAFASGRAQTLVATDVAARGIHIDDVACVVHHDLPADEKDYVHRSGRTGRANAEGVVVSLVENNQMREVKKLIRKLSLDADITEPDLIQVGTGTVVKPRPASTETSTPKKTRPRDRDRAKSFNKRNGREGGSRGSRFEDRDDRPQSRDRNDRYRDRDDRPRSHGERDRTGRNRDDRPQSRDRRDFRDRDDRPPRRANGDRDDRYRDRDDRPRNRTNSDRDDRPRYRTNSDRDDRPRYRGDRDDRPRARGDRDSRPQSRDRDDRYRSRDDRPQSRDDRPRDRDDRPYGSDNRGHGGPNRDRFRAGDNERRGSGSEPRRRSGSSPTGGPSRRPTGPGAKRRANTAGKKRGASSGPRQRSH